MGLDIYLLFSIIGISAVITFIAYRRFIFDLFDPLSFFLLTLIADSALMLVLPWATYLKWEYVGFFLSLWAGFAFRGNPSATHPAVVFNKRALFELEFVLAVLFMVILVGNLYLGLTAGFPLFSLHPSEAKVTALTGGVGIVRRINMGPYQFFSCGCLLLAVIGYNRRFLLLVLSIATFLVVLSGSKGALLPVIFIVAFLLAHGGLNKNSQFRMRATKYLVIMLGVGVGIGILITTKDTGSLSAGITAYFMRFLMSGDVILFYFPRRDEIMTLVDPNFFEYMHHLLGDLLGMLRIGDYQGSLGSIIVGNDDGFGPNSQFFVQSDLFFGPFFGMLYSFIVGYIMASFRARFFEKATRSAVWLVFELLLAVSAFTLAIEAGMLVITIFTTAVVVLPLWLLARLCWICASYPIGGHPNPRRLSTFAGKRSLKAV